MIRVVFMGSSDFSCRSFEELLADPEFDVVLALTQPDRPKGRNLKVAPCPARASALERGIRVISPGNPNCSDLQSELKSCNADFFAVVAYGHILKRQLLDMPRYGCINVHASLLPKYRGAAPIQWAVARGECISGVTTMFMVTGMDKGDIVYSDEERISPDDTGGSLHDRLALKGARLLVKTLKDINAGSAPRAAQNHALATYAPKLKKDDARISWQEPAEVICNKIRAFNPWPVSWCMASDAMSGKKECRIRVYSAKIIDVEAEPGVIACVGREGIDVGTGLGTLRIDELQAEGGRQMKAEEFLQGHNVVAGRRFN